jgi:hypothetical protein
MKKTKSSFLDRTFLMILFAVLAFSIAIFPNSFKITNNEIQILGGISATLAGLSIATLGFIYSRNKKSILIIPIIYSSFLFLLVSALCVYQLISIISSWFNMSTPFILFFSGIGGLIQGLFILFVEWKK